MIVGGIVAIIAVLSAVQSVFGMGVLVFGTPTLLLLGFDFSEALGWLLPASIAISAAQVAGDRARAVALVRSGLPFWCLVPLAAALALVLVADVAARIDLAIGFAMIAAALIRLVPAAQQRLGRAVLRYERGYLVIMGVVHGLTNMGGALLSIYASAGAGDKRAIRATISTYYLCFGVVQLATLALLRPAMLGVHSLVAAAVGALVYLQFGRRVFRRASARGYACSLTSFMAIYGMAVLLKSAL